MLATGSGIVGLFVRGIQPSKILKLLSAGNNNLPNRIIRVIPINQSQIIVVGPVFIPSGDRKELPFLLVAELFKFLYVGSVSDSLHLFPPAESGIPSKTHYHCSCATRRYSAPPADYFSKYFVFTNVHRFRPPGNRFLGL